MSIDKIGSRVTRFDIAQLTKIDTIQLNSMSIYMWEMNAIVVSGNWNETDEGLNSTAENPIRDYVNNVLKLVISKYSEPFPWGQVDVKLSLLDKISMKFSQILWF